MAVETGIGIDISIVLGLLAAASAVALPPYFRAYYRWLNDPRKYPEAKHVFSSLGKTAVVNEEEARGSARFLIDHATNSLEIASPELKASVWNEQVAASLQKALKNHPSLQVKVLTGQEIIGDKRGKHPFYLACRQEPEPRVSLGTLRAEEFTSLQGVRADKQLFRKTGASSRELSPASIVAFRDYGNGDDCYQSLQAWEFMRDFAVLWRGAEKWPATIVRAAA